jgi:hypothetical protein
MEHRWGARVTVDMPVRVRCRSGKFVDAHLVNISRSGALIHTEMTLARFAPVEIELQGCSVLSYVVRLLSDGVGVEWSGPLPRILENALLARSVTTSPPHWTHPSAEPVRGWKKSNNS